MKVCYVVPNLDYATGWGRWAVDFFSYIQKYEVEPIIITNMSSAPFLKEYGLNFRCIFCIPERLVYFQSKLALICLKGLFDLITIIKKITDISLVHSFEAYPWGFYGHLVASYMKIPHIITTHGHHAWLAKNRLIDHLLCEAILRKADTIIPVSYALGEEIIKRYENKINKTTLRPIWNGVNIEKLLKAGNSVKIEKIPNEIRILSVSRFTPVKGIDISLLAFKIVKEKYRNAKYIIIGEGIGNDYYRKINYLIQRYKIKDVYIFGKISNLKDLVTEYLKADVFLQTSYTTFEGRFDSFPLTVLEAAAFGIPIVASKNGGIPEAVHDNISALLVEEKDVSGTAAAIVKILSNEEIKSRLSKEAKKVAEKLSCQNMAIKYINAYRESLKN